MTRAKSHPLILWSVGLAFTLGLTAFIHGCEDDDSSTPVVGSPQLVVGADFQCNLGENYLPITTREEIQSRELITTVVTVEGTDPEQPSTRMVDGTPIDLFVANEQGEMVTAAGSFVSSPSPVDAISGDLTLSSGQVKDQFYCLQPGVFYLFASTDIYTAEDGAALRSNRGFPVRCVDRDTWRCQCNDDCGDASLDAFVDASPDMDTSDASDMGMDAELPAWTMSYDSPSAESLEIGIRGSFREGRGDNIILVYKIEDQNGAPTEPVSVSFQLAPDSPRDIQLQPSTVETDAMGFARVRVVAGTTPGVTAVVATASWRNQTETVTSPTISIRGGIPSHRGFTFACDTDVLPAYHRRGQADWPMALVPDAARCTVRLSDRLGGVIDEPTQVFYLSESGSVDQAVPTNNVGLSTTNFGVGEPSPDDILPVGLFNAADGLTTLVAITRGEEQFTDVNANGLYDMGEPLEDLPEPFVDSNDNGTHDQGELYRDTNGDGQWNQANGQWDNNIEIWRSTRILLTGESSPVTSYVTPTCRPGQCSLAREFDGRCPDPDPENPMYYFADAGQLRLTISMLDDNSNCTLGEIEVESDIGDLEVTPSILESFEIGVEDCINNNQPEGRIFNVTLYDSDPRPPGEPPPPEVGEVRVITKWPLAGGGEGSHTYVFPVCVP